MFLKISDNLKACRAPFWTSQVELWWVKYRTSTGRRQWSDFIVRLWNDFIPFHKFIALLILESFNGESLNIVFYVFFYSPQAIFKDPFRGGNNILVSLMSTMSTISFQTFNISHSFLLRWLIYLQCYYRSFVTHTLQQVNQFQQINDTELLKSSATQRLFPRSHGKNCTALRESSF